MKISFFFTFFCLLLSGTRAALNYHGKYVGALKSYHHGLGGDVYVVDSRTLHIRNFAYDGEGPAGYFYVSNTKTPNENGIKLRDERGGLNPLKRYRKQHITLTLPEGKTVSNIKWFYVWCDEFSVNFGDIRIPKNLDFPKPQKIGKLNGVHAVSSDNVVVVDAQTLLIPSFSYDGEAPDAKFWVGSGSKPTPQGIRVPDENGKEEPLRRYDKKTIVLTLPADLTIFDIGHFGIWCEAFTVDFGHIQIPKDLNIPPSLKMLGVSPQSKLNCEILYDDLAFEVRWAVAGDSIVTQLVAKLEKSEYMSFGVSGEIDKNVMVGADVVVAWVDHDTLNGYAYDYYLDSKSQCAGTRGSCPDYKLQPNSDSVRLLNAALVNGYSIVTYQRPLRAHDVLDLPIYTNGSQAIIWAIGPLNGASEVSYHSITSKALTLLDFGRTPQWNCPIPESDASVAHSENNEKYQNNEHDAQPFSVQAVYPEPTTPPTGTTNKVSNRQEAELRKTNTVNSIPTPAPAPRNEAWSIPAIQCYEPEDGVYYAQMGPTGGKRGYSAITGHVGWGISWYINGLLIPEINVVRGNTYTFIVEGGLDPEIPAKYHPFYITDDPVGGFLYKTAEEKSKVQIFAGVTQNKAGELIPTGVGRLCNWTPDPDQPPADEFLSFGAYQRTLSLVCDHGEPGLIQWTPDENTPDTVYYQCYTHRYLGWKINVHDICDKESAASEPVTSKIKIKKTDHTSYDSEDPLQSDHSIQVSTRIKAANETTSVNQKDNLPIYSEAKKNFLLLPSQLSENLKQDFINVEQQEVLQNPYVLPPPYQKNFDYQSMQTSESASEMPITEQTKVKSVSSSVSTVNNYSPQVTYSEVNSTSTQKTTQPSISNSNKQHLKVPYRNSHAPHNNNNNNNNNNPYAMQKTSPMVATSKNQYPAIHIHIIKHGEDSGEETVPLPAPILNQPLIAAPTVTQAHYRHPILIKKPAVKRVIIPGGDQKAMLNLPTNHIDSEGSGSISSKTVLLPPLSNKSPFSYGLPHTIQQSQTATSKKTYATTNRKKMTTTKQPEHSISYRSQNLEMNQIRKGNGFDPNSIVMEGGFKPIVPNSLPSAEQTAQDRMAEETTDYVEIEDTQSNNATANRYYFNSNNTVEDEFNNVPVNNNHRPKNPFEGKEPELFEPIFIPSPPVSELQKKKKPSYEYANDSDYKYQKPSQSNVLFIRHKPKLTTAGSIYQDYYLTNSITEHGNKHNQNYRLTPVFRMNKNDEALNTSNATAEEEVQNIDILPNTNNNLVLTVSTKNISHISHHKAEATAINNTHVDAIKGKQITDKRDAFIIMVPNTDEKHNLEQLPR